MSGHGEGQNAYKLALIDAILQEEDLYKILAASRSSSPADLRRCYLERSKILHPDKAPFHPQSTLAFQRIAFAFDILKSPSTRRTYDRASRPLQPIAGPTVIGDDHHFRNTLATLRHEFTTGTFATVRSWLDDAHRRYPHWFSERVVHTIDRTLLRSRKLFFAARNYKRLLCREFGRVNRVRKKFRVLGYTEVRARARLTGQLLRTVLAIPMRIDRGLKQQQEQRGRARTAGLQAATLPISEAGQAGVILNEKFIRFIEIIVGDAGKDDVPD